MKYLVVLSTLVISTIAKPQSMFSQYGVPRPEQLRPSDASKSIFSQSFVSSGSSGSSSSRDPMDGPKIYKHISIHVPPAEEDEEERPMKRVIRPMEKPDKIVNIIFVKAPSSSRSQQTEVILPEYPQTRTVVYVLLKKSSGSSDIKIREPKPTRPPKPAVFFIKYGKVSKKEKGQASSGSSGSSGSSESSSQGGYQR